MNVRVLGLVLICTVAATGWLLWGTTSPLGVPGEWAWPRLPLTAETIVGGGSALIAGALYVGFVLWSRRGLERAHRLAVTGRLVILVAAAFLWLWTVQQCVPAPADLGKGPYVLFYPRSSGYFWQARNDAGDTGQFLAGYEELLAEGDFLHLGTHPPGLTLGYRGLIALCEASPALSDAVLATCPASVRESLEAITAMSAQSGRTVSRADQAVVWLAELITLLAAAATTLGIYALVRRHFDRQAAWAAAGLWPLVPAIAIFHPKSDTLYPFLAVAAAAVWLSACDRRSLLWAVLAGALMWLGMLLSLAFVAVGLLIAVMTAWEWWARSQRVDPSVAGRDGRCALLKQGALLVLGCFAGFAIPTVGMALMWGINLIGVWRWNVANHAVFYEHNVRTWWKWFLINPWELALAVGLPICAAAVVSLWRMAQDADWSSPRAAVPGGFLIVWGLLWCSGKNMGEAARLWILLMPWVVMSAGRVMEDRVRFAEADPPAGRSSPNGPISPTALIFSAQMIVCVLTVLRIDGFQFTELVETAAAGAAKWASAFAKARFPS